MSSREELLEALLPTYRAQYAPGEEESANALIDAYAHELAEKQRSYLLPEECDPHVPYNRTVRNLADLIDPEVSS